MNPALALGLSLAALSLAACGRLIIPQPPPADPEAELESLIEREEYAEAKALLQSLPEPELGTREPSLEHRIRVYETQRIESAHALQRDGKWSAAIVELEQGLQQVPESIGMQVELAQLRAERSFLLRKSREREVLAEARYLTARTGFLAERERLRGLTEMEREEWQRIEATLPALGAELIEAGSAAVARGELDFAGECLEQARINAPERMADQAYQEWLAAVAERNQASADAAKRLRQKAQRQRARFLQTRLHEAMSQGDLHTARESLAELVKLQGASAELAELDQALHNAITAKVTELQAQANRAYAGGRIEEARTAWTEVLTLDAGNTDARTGLERADRVLKNLRELQREQQVSPIPPPTGN